MMNDIIWNDPAVQAAAIGAVGTFLATTVAALCASLIGHQVAGRKKLLDKLESAHADLDFLLAVEAEHCLSNIQSGFESNKIRIRSVVRDKGFVWSGKNTPGRR